MQFRFALALLAIVSADVHAQACIVHSQAERLNVKVCQENVSVPPKLFKDSFCQPQLAGQQVEVQFVDQCPSGAFGVCRNALVANMPYREHLHYYGVTTDARYLQPFCEQQSKGTWEKP